MIAGPTDHHAELQKEERGPLAYVAGSILRTIHNKAAFHKKNDPWQEEIKTLFANTLLADSKENNFIASMDRGGLWTPPVKVIEIIEIVEKHVESLRTPPPSPILLMI